MSANFEAKKLVVEEITSKIKASKSVVFVDYNKLTVAEVSELRNKCREAGCEYKVYKNTLVRKAFNDLGFNQFDEALNGPTAIAFAADEVTAAKIMAKAAKDYDGKIVLKCGFADNTYVDVKGVEALATMPSKEELVAGASFQFRRRARKPRFRRCPRSCKSGRKQGLNASAYSGKTVCPYRSTGGGSCLNGATTKTIKKIGG